MQVVSLKSWQDPLPKTNFDKSKVSKTPTAKRFALETNNYSLF